MEGPGENLLPDGSKQQAGDEDRLHPEGAVILEPTPIVVACGPTLLGVMRVGRTIGKELRRSEKGELELIEVFEIGVALSTKKIRRKG